MRLFLVRHGTAEENRGGSDAARALAFEGRTEIEEVSGAIGAAMEPPVELLSSPYLRAEQTAELLRERLKLPSKIRPTDAMLPESDWGALCKALADMEARGAKTVIAVGHNPSISLMVGGAVANHAGARVAMAKGAVACIDLEGVRDHPVGKLRWLITPKALRGAKRG
jgi:phosphohistidine phosphatase